MAEIPTITEDQIRQRVGDASFERGRPYALRGAIFDARRQGMTLKACCEGTAPEPYRLWVTFGAGGIVAADCSCPVGAGGYCKHIAALLLTWRERPREFAEVEEVDAALERRSKAELIALIKQMLLQEPELEALLETPLPVGPGGGKPADKETYRRQAAAVFRRAGSGWGAESKITHDLLAIKVIGDGFADQGDFASAARVHDAISEVVIENYEYFDDEEGELAVVISECVEGLGRCLAGGLSDPAEREQVLEALFAVYQFDLEQGGREIGGQAPDLIIEHATAEEKRTVAGWVREALQTARSSGDWARQAYGEFLLDLEADTLDDESFLRICRETGRSDSLVTRLIELGRIDEALDESERVSDYDLLRLTEVYEYHGRPELAERLVRERSVRSQDLRLGDWLKERYKARGDLASALELAEKRFAEYPSLAGYKELRELAEPLGRWRGLREQLHAALKRSAHTSHLLVEIHLDEGEIDRALAAVKSEQPSYLGYGYSGGTKLKVARAAEATRPREALAIYREQIERLINLRGRENYQQACEFLTKVRALYGRLGEQGEWAAYIADLRERHRGLPALKQELAAARL